jgi:hypothetical protein
MPSELAFSSDRFYLCGDGMKFQFKKFSKSADIDKQCPSVASWGTVNFSAIARRTRISHQIIDFDESRHPLSEMTVIACTTVADVRGSPASIVFAPNLQRGSSAGD